MDGAVGRARRTMGGGREAGEDRRGRRVPPVPRSGCRVEQVRATEAAVATATLRVEDPELRPPVRGPVAVPLDADLRPLPDDLPAQPDPAAPAELQPQPNPGERVAKAGGEIRRLEHEEERPGPPGEREEPGELVGGARGRAEPATSGCARAGIPGNTAAPFAEVENEDVHHSGLEERAGHRERLGRSVRDEYHEPFEPDAPGDRLHRVQAPREVDPRDKRPARLRLPDGPEGERRRAGGAGAPERDAPRAGEPADREQHVEIGEAGRHDPPDLVRDGRRAGRQGDRGTTRERDDPRTGDGSREQARPRDVVETRDLAGLRRERARARDGNRDGDGRGRDGERPEDLRRRPRSCRTPALP